MLRAMPSGESVLNHDRVRAEGMVNRRHLIGACRVYAYMATRLDGRIRLAFLSRGIGQVHRSLGLKRHGLGGYGVRRSNDT